MKVKPRKRHQDRVKDWIDKYMVQDGYGIRYMKTYRHRASLQVKLLLLRELVVGRWVATFRWLFFLWLDHVTETTADSGRFWDFVNLQGWMNIKPPES